MSSPLATFSFPTTTLVGPGTVTELASRLSHFGSRRPLVVTDPGLLETRAFQLLKNALGSASAGPSWEIFSGVHPNPVEQDVIDAANAFREKGCDAVIAFGGGSALDVGKACRLLIKRPEAPLGRFDFNADWSGLAPCVCIPTT